MVLSLSWVSTSLTISPPRHLYNADSSVSILLEPPRYIPLPETSAKMNSTYLTVAICLIERVFYIIWEKTKTPNWPYSPAGPLFPRLRWLETVVRMAFHWRTLLLTVKMAITINWGLAALITGTRESIPSDLQSWIDILEETWFATIIYLLLQRLFDNIQMHIIWAPQWRPQWWPKSPTKEQ
ncbi:hypothetical protein F4777DRAFT_572686 [Nemania sp. FL0916]|nr:hypothetical protein F4777DRAFT_572686 [Nemania sp. FL0916]